MLLQDQLQKVLQNAPKHYALWGAFFKRYAWLKVATKKYNCNPVLIGPGLDSYYNDQSRNEKYMILIAEEMTGDLRYEKKLFFECLQPYSSFNSTTYEIKFNCGITLNAMDILRGP